MLLPTTGGDGAEHDQPGSMIAAAPVAPGMSDLHN